MSVNYIKATPEDIKRIVDRIETVIEGEQNTNVAIACVVVAVLSQKPDIPPNDLPVVVKDVSEFLAAYLTSAEVTH